MNILNQTYKELAIPYFKEVFDIIDEVLVKLDIPFYLIGVNAVSLSLLKKGIKPSRGTKDIDFALMISSMDQYDKVSDALIAKGFNKVKAPWTFYAEKFNLVIDLLPYGEVEEKDTVHFSQRKADLHVLGFKEVLENADQIAIENKIANIPPLPGMIILKLVAWSDRPEERENDLADILKIIEHYFDFEFDEIVEFHNDTFPEDTEIDPWLIAAEVLGRKAIYYLQKSEKLSNRIHKLLHDNLTELAKSVIAREWARQKDWEVNRAFDILKAFEKGLNRE